MSNSIIILVLIDILSPNVDEQGFCLHHNNFGNMHTYIHTEINTYVFIGLYEYLIFFFKIDKRIDALLYVITY